MHNWKTFQNYLQIDIYDFYKIMIIEKLLQIYHIIKQ